MLDGDKNENVLLSIIVNTYNAFKIIKKEIHNISNCSYYAINHSGISKSRNFGLKKTKGAYIMFVDGDDYIMEDVIIKIINYLKSSDYDLTLFNTIKYFENKNYFEIEKFSIQNEQSLSEKDLINNKICARPWRFIYKREMLEDNSINFRKIWYMRMKNGFLKLSTILNI